jgi:NADH-quinone oxidoreductase subunit G
MGALTSKPYAFTARSWELRSIDSIDILDTEGVNTKINVRGNNIMRILPRINYDINMEWISDRTRFSYDGNNRQRILSPLLNFQTCGNLLNINLMDASWSEVLAAYKRFFQTSGKALTSVLGSTLDFKAIVALFKFNSNLGQSHKFFLVDSFKHCNIDLVNYFSFNLPFKLFSSFLEVCIFIGFNPRFESPVFNIRLKNLVTQNNLRIFTFGYNTNLNYSNYNLGNSTTSILKLFEARHKIFRKIHGTGKLAFIFGSSAFSRADFRSLFNSFHFVMMNFFPPKAEFSFNVMLPSVSLTNSFYTGVNYTVRWFYTTLKIDNFFYLISTNFIKFKNFIPVLVFQGSHFEENNLIYFPSLTYFEKNSIFRNAEGRFQSARIAISPVSDKIKNDWRIVKALGDYMGIESFSNSDTSNISLNKMEDFVVSNNIFSSNRLININKIVKINFSSFIFAPCLADSLTRNSVTMALVSVVLNSKFSNFI